MVTKTKLQRLGPNQRKWLKALESGKFVQTTNMLHRSSGGYCCLGVGAELFKSKTTSIEHRFTDGIPCLAYDGALGCAPIYVVKALDLFTSEGHRNSAASYSSTESLTGLNDGGKTFKAIAALIRKNPSMYFREPR